jgi:hypothetical protein
MPGALSCPARCPAGQGPHSGTGPGSPSSARRARSHRYVFANYGALQGSGGIAEEVNGGTLEQAHFSPARPALLMLGRLAVLAAESLTAAIVLGIGFGLGYRVQYTLGPTCWCRCC